MALVESLRGAAILFATSAVKPWFWKVVILDTKYGGPGTPGECGIGFSVVVQAISVSVVAVLGGQVTVPPDPKTTFFWPVRL